MKTIKAISNRISFFTAQIKRIFGVFYTRDLYPQYKDCIGKYTYGLPQIFKLEESSKFQIGKFCSIANDVKIFLDGEHEINNISTYPFGYFKGFTSQKRYKTKSKGKVIIGNDVWIGYGVTILSGVNIGDGAVIGAKSLVVKNVPAYTVVGGVPAKIIKKRFNDDTIEALKKIQWWNWSDKKIQNNIDNLKQDSLEKFLNQNE